MKTKQIIALSTSINGRTNYVAYPMHTRYDNRKIPTFTQEPNDARDFGSEKEVEKFLKNIHNPHDRVYRIEKIRVSAEAARNLDIVAGELT